MRHRSGDPGVASGLCETAQRAPESPTLGLSHLQFEALLSSSRQSVNDSDFTLVVMHRDLNWGKPKGNWLAHNLKVAAALAEAGYDFRLELGNGGHNPNHGGVLLPHVLRWIFRPEAVEPSPR